MKKSVSITLLSATILLSGCGILFTSDDETVMEVANNLLEAQKDQYGDKMKVDMPIRVNYSIHRKPVINKELEVEFEFLPERDIPVLRAATSSSDGLEIVDGEMSDQYQDIKARQYFKRYVTVVPKEEELYYLNLYIVTEIGEDKRAQHIKIPIALGEHSKKVIRTRN
jgi:hypothetical protein